MRPRGRRGRVHLSDLGSFWNDRTCFRASAPRPRLTAAMWRGCRGGGSRGWHGGGRRDRTGDKEGSPGPGPRRRRRGQGHSRNGLPARDRGAALTHLQAPAGGEGVPHRDPPLAPGHAEAPASAGGPVAAVWRMATRWHSSLRDARTAEGGGGGPRQGRQGQGAGGGPCHVGGGVGVPGAGRSPGPPGPALGGACVKFVTWGPAST